MQFTASLLPLSLAALALAAPAVEKREVGQVTLFKGINYSGQSTTLTIDTTVNEGCTEIPSSFNNQVNSLRIRPQLSTFHCRLFDAAGCDPGPVEGDTWNIWEDVPNLSGGVYTIGNRASSIYCATSA